jgi:hypothetical protein
MYSCTDPMILPPPTGLWRGFGYMRKLEQHRGTYTAWINRMCEWCMYVLLWGERADAPAFIKPAGCTCFRHTVCHAGCATDEKKHSYYWELVCVQCNDWMHSCHGHLLCQEPISYLSNGFEYRMPCGDPNVSSQTSDSQRQSLDEASELICNDFCRVHARKYLRECSKHGYWYLRDNGCEKCRFEYYCGGE